MLNQGCDYSVFKVSESLSYELRHDRLFFALRVFFYNDPILANWWFICNICDIIINQSINQSVSITTKGSTMTSKKYYKVLAEIRRITKNGKFNKNYVETK